MFYESTIRTCSYPSVTFIYESIGKGEFELEKRTSIVFHDEDRRDKSDVFETEISIEGLYALVKKFHELAYTEIIKDIGQV